MGVKRDHIQSIQIDHASDVGVCRRKASSFAKKLGFADVKMGEIAIIVSEMVSNVVKHANAKGHFVMCRVQDDHDHIGLETWCCDEGDGIANPSRVMQDGVSNKNTLGLGMGSIRRLSDEFEINPEKPDQLKYEVFSSIRTFNTCLRSRKWLPNLQWTGSSKHLELGASSRPKPGETLNGDSYAITHLSATRTLVSVIDGLGHGKEAHLASSLAKEQILLRQDSPVDVLIKQIHSALKGTRGATVALALIDSEKKTIRFTGIGNIETWVFSEIGKKGLLSYGGIIGHNMRTPKIFDVDFSPGDTLCMFSDGISTRWNCDDIEMKANTQSVAESIMNKFSKINDDASILVVRYAI